MDSAADLPEAAAAFDFERFVHAKRDVRRLFVDRDRQAARVAVEPEPWPGVADVADGLARDARDVDVARRGDLARHVHLAREHERLARDASVRILREDGVEHRVRDRVRDFVGMTFGDAFGGE